MEITNQNTKKMAISIILALTLLLSSMLVIIPITTPTVLAQSNSNMYPDQIDHDYTREELLSYEWTQDRSNPSLDAYIEGPSPTSFDVAWKMGDGASFQGGFYNMVFVRQSDKTLGVDPWTGEELWSIDYTGSIIKLDEEYMMIGTRCIRFATKEVVWQADFSAGTSTVYIPDLKQFYTTNGIMWKLNSNDMTVKPTLAWNRSDLMEGSQHYYTWNTYGDGRMYVRQITALEVDCFDAITGELLWRQNTKGRLIFGGIFHEGVYTSGSLDGTQYGFDAATGEVLWTFDPGTFWNMWASRPGAAAYGIFYGINCDRHMYALDMHTGNLIWKYKGPGHYYNNHAIVVGGHVYYVSGTDYYRDPNTYEFGEDEFVCLDAFTGEVIFKAPIAPANAAYSCFGNLYLMPRWYDPMGGNTGGTGGSLLELWCISGKPQDWAMFGTTPSHTWTGSGPQNLDLKWMFETEGAVISAPTIVDGITYFGSYDKNIYAVDAKTGSLIWKFPTEFRICSSMAVVNGKLYTGADDGNIYCLDAKTGTKLWSTYVGGPLTRYFTVEIGPQTRSSPTVINNKVYIGHLNGYLYCLDANSGSIIWNYQTGGEIMGSPAVVDNAVYINSNTVPSTNGTLYKLNADTGSIIWTLGIPYDRDESKRGGFATSKTAHWLASPTVGDDMVFIPADGRYQYCINATTAEIIWFVLYSPAEESLVPNMMSMIYDPGIPTWVESGPPLVEEGFPYPQYELKTTGNGKVYTMDSFFSIAVINVTTGETIRKIWLGREVYGLSYSLKRIYSTYEQKATFVYDSDTGEKISYWEIGSMSWSKPSLYNGNMYVGCHDWKVYCFGERDIGTTTYYGSQGQPFPASASEPGTTTYYAEEPMPAEPTLEGPTANESIEPELTEPEATFVTNEVAIIAAVAIAVVIGAVSFFVLNKRRK